jgi:hypothetical protein
MAGPKRRPDYPPEGRQLMAGPKRRPDYPPEGQSLENIADSLEKIALYLEVIAEKINPDAFTEEDNQ